MFKFWLDILEDLAFKVSKSDGPTSKEQLDVFIPCAFSTLEIQQNIIDETSIHLVGNVTLHRVEFQNALAHHLKQKAITTHFDKRLLEYILKEDGSIELHFKDGSTELCDVLVGADGIHSSTRQAMIKLASDEAQAAGDSELVKELNRPGVKDPVWSGTAAYRCVFPSERLKELNPNHATLNAPINVSPLTMPMISVLTRNLVCRQG